MKTIQYEMTRTVNYRGSFVAPEDWDNLTDEQRQEYFLSLGDWSYDEECSDLQYLGFSDA